MDATGFNKGRSRLPAGDRPTGLTFSTRAASKLDGYILLIYANQLAQPRKLCKLTSLKLDETSEENGKRIGMFGSRMQIKAKKGQTLWK